MKNICLFLIMVLALRAAYSKTIAEPDSALLFAYATTKNNNKNGLHYAWTIDEKKWHLVGPEHSFVRSDYGTWGAQKRMIAPVVIRGVDNRWHAIWQLNEQDGVFAYASSDDLIFWNRQSYPQVLVGDNVSKPEINWDETSNQYVISCFSPKSKKNFRAVTKDLKNYEHVSELEGSSYGKQRVKVHLNGAQEEGTLHKVAWEVIDKIINAQKLEIYKSQLHNERAEEDVIRFADLKPVKANFSIELNHQKRISDHLLGIFFEDINYAADGGLYAELIQNRGFEYHPHDKKGSDPNWNSFKSWKLEGKGITHKIDTVNPIHINNRNYITLFVTAEGGALLNEGFDGIVVRNGQKYDFSVFAKKVEGNINGFVVELLDDDGKIIAQQTVNSFNKKWQKKSLVLMANGSAKKGILRITPQGRGEIALDMVSLFPQETFKNRKNGLRKDLAETIAAMHPRFVRFPGGCVAHGDGIHNIYNWKNTIGKLEERKPQRNLWGYHQSVGLGYYEYFQFCEDLGAAPLPVIAAGVPCQNSSDGGAGQQCGIPLHEMDNYIQDILDLIEYANGDRNTYWGKKRAAAGHPEPFNLKYLGIGNEDLITDIFEERFTLIFNAIKDKYPEIVVIGTAGPFNEGTDYVEGWKIADKLNVPMMDEHYYQTPGWFIYNQDFYDRYDRNKSKVYLGEYAAHLPGRPNNLETALAEAIHLTALERNGDIVEMTSYAPLLAKEGFTQWNPDLIYFNNEEVKPTVGYEVQKLFGENVGTHYVNSTNRVQSTDSKVTNRIATSVVWNENRSELILKMVNMLPVATDIEVDAGHFALFGAEVEKIELSDIPSSKTARPVKSFMDLKDLNQLRLPPYSLTIFKLIKK
ncbi:alpha-L-arabinofuranosidase [Sphingobacterium alkalisoli]|uniref:non-reducing end alpha-L-arabinofuranosidase n=1 Tax=Sphingobacterium alkalisoli TaxID=1874115 RepID=A0A4U0GU09_9SPHI|nr:alpha-L-arabinofuranosidase C-terminal domain-containing protein [Sphingobacterium alkalisoli]TJY62447.1 alpha-L-arabinofuranosidase [Sphingobacterium alkalisoli]